MYTFDSRVRYSEISKEGTLALSSAINYMQDCSTFQSEALGMGVEYLKERRLVWLLNSWQIEIGRLPALAEDITIGTWAYGFHSMYGYRNFVIDDRAGNHLLRANSVWIFYDLEKKRPVRVTEEEVRGYGGEPKLDMDYAERKIAVPEAGILGEAFPVRKYQIDTNGHVNNGQYVRMAQEYIPEDFKTARLRVEYRRSAVYGDVIYPLTAGNENGYVISLNDYAGKAFAVVSFEAEEDKKAQLAGKNGD